MSVDKNLDQIYEMMDELLLDGMFDVANLVISFVAANFNMFDDNEILAYLTTSSWAQDKVASRNSLYNVAEKHLGKDILNGLK